MNNSAHRELFVEDSLKVYSKEIIVSLVKKQKNSSLILAKRNGKTYIRSKSNQKTADNIAFRTISHSKLASFCKNYLKAISNQKIKDFGALRRKKALRILSLLEMIGEILFQLKQSMMSRNLF